MKKIALIIGIAAMLALTACGGNKKENVQTEAAAQETTAAETTSMGDYTAVSLPEEYEPAFYEGTVSDYTGNFITINGENGELKFDLEGAELPEDSTIIRGCYVEVSYADAAENGTYPADGLSLLNDNEQLAQEENRDPVIYGKLQVMDINELEIVDDAGRTIDFDNSISRVVSFADLKEGDNVIVTYAGSVYKNEEDDSENSGVFDGAPVAIKIVAEDAAKTEDAEANYIDGTVSGIEGNRIDLSTEIADFNCELEDEAMLADVAEEQHVRVYYTGSIADIVIAVEKLEKLD